MNISKPLLSVLLLTYNHEKWIAQSIEGALNQKTNFSIEILIGDDCSTDNTRKIVKEYEEKYPNKVKAFLHEKNLGPPLSPGKYNYIYTIKASKGKYIALCEGDDYWTDPYKLQKQVDFLEKNSNFVGCSHNTELYYEKENKRENLIQSEQVSGENSIINLIDGSAYFHSSSYVWRNIFINGFPKAYYYNSPLIGDWFLSMLYAQYGKIHYIDQVMSCYRITGEGIWTKLNKHQKYFNNIRGMYLYNKLLNYKYAQQFTRIWWACNEVMQIIKNENGNKLLYLKLWFLKHSIDVRANHYTRILGQNIKEFKNKYVAAISKKWHGFTQLHVVCCLSNFFTFISRYYLKMYTLYNRFFYKIMRLTGMSKAYNLFSAYGSKLIIFLFRGIQKIYSKGLHFIDIFIMKTCEFVFQAFFLWDANRYFVYYKLKIYEFFKIAIYKKI